MTPEREARQTIDRMLEESGWQIQNYAERATDASFGVAVREYPLRFNQRADYLLFIGGVAVGVIEAKPEGTPLSGALQQAERYRANLPNDLPNRTRFFYSYASIGIETYFRDFRDPDSRSRQVFIFHTPQALFNAFNQPQTLQERLKTGMLPLKKDNLRVCQFEAIKKLETSLAESRPRALIQMATGSGKTYAAVSSVYRLIKFADIKRVLFLVDRNNLGRQALREFRNYTAPDDGRKFTELYNVQHLASNVIDEVSEVCITTIQRLYSMLKGEPDYESDDEESSDFEHETENSPPQEVTYNPKIPIDTFDLIIVDECHRSIYGKWRHVLEYFDAFILGLTATPYSQTLNFFNQNLVYEYRHEQAIEDKVNVGYYVYRIKTEITESGSTVAEGSYVARRDRVSRRLTWEELDEDETYTGNQLDRDVVAEDQIRTVIQTFRDVLFAELFPSRRIVPKTLIFAKDDFHAEDIVQIVREEFAKGDDFCQKITYRSDRPEDLIRQFRTQFNPRIAVSVDMISTGTDIKPLECLVFMRSVRSSGYFEQMIGRGVRTINTDDLRSVTSDATAKTHFIIVDAVGVCESVKIDSQSRSGEPSTTEPNGPGEENRDQLMDDVSVDRVIETGFAPENFEQVVTVIHDFKRFIHEHMDELPALQILCERSEAQGTLTEDSLKELEEALQEHSSSLSRESLWMAYERRSSENVRGITTHRTDLISLVRFAMRYNRFLEPFSAIVNRNFEKWLDGKDFTPVQREWLEMIQEYIATSLEFRISDFEYTPFAQRGGVAKAYQLFGDELEDILTDLTEKLVS
ncbi:type III restriction endonuclease subunit R [Candidatus Poribacteria bacterium]|nr:MAG: type III restriction endonuclease subunit R [Candidatus Poribacteria bacterium]